MWKGFPPGSVRLNLQKLAPSWLPMEAGAAAASAMAQAGASCSVRIDRTLRPVEAGVCLVERDFGLVQQRNGTMLCGPASWK